MHLKKTEGLVKQEITKGGQQHMKVLLSGERGIYSERALMWLGPLESGLAFGFP